ncbi:MAG: DUF4233 domain-containing protein [Micrococcales bacterium]|nr:DUF4233 domain-containing protein [Micrococcales bacterium]
MSLPIYGRQGKFTFRMLAAVLVGQSIVIFFGALVARGLAAAGGDEASASRLLWVGSGLAVLALVGAGLMRSPLGITVGWLVQVLTLASAFVVTDMLFAGLIFGALWVYCLHKGRQIDRDMAAREAELAQG